MSDALVITLAVGALVLLIVIRTPVAFALMGSGTLGLLLLDGPSVTAASLGSEPFRTIGQYSLIVIPMFIAMGMFVLESGLATKLFAVVQRDFGRLPGGVAVATVLASAGFSAVSGSSVAAVSTVGKVSLPQMMRQGYSPPFATGVVAAAGTLGILIPPSIALVIYAQITRESVGELLIAGIIPGLVVTAAYVSFIVLTALFRPTFVGLEVSSPEQSDHGEGAERVSALGVYLRIALLFAIVLGGIYLGLATATESAAIGAVAAAAIMVVDLRHLGARELMRRIAHSLRETASLTGMIFALLVGSGLFSIFIVRAGLPRDFTAWVIQLEVAPAIVVVALLLLLVPLGMFMDGISMLVISMPLAYPVVDALGFSGVWFGILVVVMIELGLITPPVGLNAYVASSVSGVPIQTVFRGVSPFYVVQMFVVSLLFLFPVLTLWLPGMMQ